MSAELSSKVQIALWWITSIAVSVLCCSILFVFFASYLVDVKQAVKDSEARIASVEAREDRILEELQLLRKRIAPLAAPVAAPVAQPADAASVPAPAVETPAVPAAPAEKK